MSVNPLTDKNIQYSIQNLQINAIILTGILILFSFADKLHFPITQSLFTSLIGSIILIFSLTSILFVGMMHGKVDLSDSDKTQKITKTLATLSTIGYILMITIGLIIILDANFSQLFPIQTEN